MSVFRRDLLGVGRWVQIEARGEDASNRTVESAAASTASSSTRFKLSVPVIIGIVAVALILIGFGVLIWRWRVRVRETARMNRSYEKYGVGRGIESSNSYSTGGSTSKSSKADPYGSFFEVETEKPKKALLNFRRSSTLTSGSTSHGGHVKQGSGWSAPSSWQRQTGAAPAVPVQPPGLGGNTGKSMSSSFSFSLKKSEEKKAPLKPQHLPNSIKSKGISAPLIVANGGPEPLWSPPITSTSNFEPLPQASTSSLLAPPQPAPPAATTTTSTTPSSFPQKFKQPQPRSPPATPGTSQKQDLLAVSRDGRRFSNGGAITSDGSLYSRNSFSSSNHDHSVPPPPPPAATPPPPSLERDVLPPAINSSNGSGNSGTVKSQRNKPGSGKGHTANQSSSYTYKRRESSTSAITAVPSSHQGSTSQYHHQTGGYGSQNQSHPHHHSQLPRLMTVIAPFTPTLEDELPLKVGDTVRIIEEYRDAWCLVQLVGRIDSPRGVVPCVCLQERKRIIPVPMNV